MEIITALLVTSDMNYAKAFTRCITDDNPLIIFTVLAADGLENCRRLKGFDLILSDIPLEIQESYILLSEKRTLSADFTTDEKILYKYDTAENLSKQISLIYCVKTGRKWLSPLLKKSVTILFCSAEGGTGKTSVALGLAQELTRFHGKKVLYVNYEEIESTGKYFEIQEEKSITNYLYYLSKGVKTEGLIDSFTVCDDYGIRAFSPSGGRNQLKLLTVEELSGFLNILQENGDFDYIIIDDDNTLSEENMWLISACDKICKVDKWGNEIKAEAFKKHLSYVLGENIYDKIITVTNFFDKTERVEDGDNSKIFIEYDNKSFSYVENQGTNSLSHINIDRDFGFGIKRLSTNLTLNLQ